MVALDDLQWADPSTWDVVPALIALRDLGPLLLLLLARPDPPPPWPSAGRVVHVELAPLTQADGRAPLAHLFPVEPDSRLTSYVMEQAGGNPFYVEELVRALREQGAIQIRGRTTLVLDPGQLGIPDSVQGVITARLDRLDDAQKRILEVASVVGRTFEATLIGQVRGHPVKAVALVLDELVHQGFDSPREMPGTYGFIHALTRDVVYGTPLKRVLRDLHRQVAEAHLVVDPDGASTPPERLAHHFSAAADVERAVPLWQQAAKRALRRSTYAEAVSQVLRAPWTTWTRSSSRRSRRPVRWVRPGSNV